MNDLVTVDRRDGVSLLQLNDPDRRNVLSAGMVGALVGAIDECEQDAGVHAIVVTGVGTAFCAGAARLDLAAAADGDTARVEHVYRGFLRVADCRLPTVAAVNGPAVGAGFNLALACDVRIAARSARFDCRFMKLALHPGGGHTWLLREAIGAQAAASMLLFGQALDGPAAAERGLALRCVEDEALIDEALALAGRTRDAPVELLATTKRTLREAASADHQAVLGLELERQLASMREQSFRSRITG